ncbi:MAG: ATP-binding protein [Clostridia bacterium]|nr:ATP-binding protein [Clostridia bacterium]
MRHKIFGNIIAGALTVFFISLIVIIYGMYRYFPSANLQDASFVSMLMGLRYYILFVFVLGVILSFVMASKVSKNVIKPINEINIENPDDDVYNEIRPLVDRINTQNRQIKQQMDELKEEHEKQNKLRREFTANVSHELKTPLTSISGYAEIMRNGFAKPEDISRFSGIIYDEAQRLISLVMDIIDLSKLEEKEIQQDKTEIDLYKVSENIVERLDTLAKKKGISFEIKGEHQFVTGVESIIEEIIYNLCDNAIKYNKENGLVMIDIQRVDGIVEYTVTDTGIGISKDELDRVFERFYRVDKSHSREMGGTGLGLSIVKHGVSYHGGEVSIKSELGSGTSVKIRFTHKI